MGKKSDIAVRDMMVSNSTIAPIANMIFSKEIFWRGSKVGNTFWKKFPLTRAFVLNNLTKGEN
jgi:hypothetical protein